MWLWAQVKAYCPFPLIENPADLLTTSSLTVFQEWKKINCIILKAQYNRFTAIHSLFPSVLFYFLKQTNKKERPYYPLPHKVSILLFSSKYSRKLLLLLLKIYWFYLYEYTVPILRQTKRGHQIILQMFFIPSCCWKLNSGPLEEQSVLLTTDPSFQSPHVCHICL